MRKRIRFGKAPALLLSLLLAAVWVAGCAENGGKPAGKEPTLVSIAVTTPPDTVAYTEGESFDPAGMVVTATMSDETTKPVTGYTYSPTGALAAGETEVRISYTEGGVTVHTEVAVTVQPAVQATLVSIAVTTPPDTVAYYEGESFDPAGMVVTATMSDETTKPVTGYTYSPTGALMAGESSVRIEYTEGNVTVHTDVAVSVSAVVLQSLQVEQAPAKVSGYQTGDAFDPSGTVLKAVYNNGKTERIEADAFSEKQVTCSASGELHSGVTSVTFGYGGATSDSVEIEVARRANERIAPVLDTYVRSDSIYVTTAAPCDHSDHGEEFLQYGDRAMSGADALQVGFGTPGFGEYYLSAGYLVFELPNVKAEGLADVQSAVLRLCLQSASVGYMDARRTVKVVIADYDKITADTTYNNLDGTDGSVSGAVTAAEFSVGKTADEWYEVDITSAVKNNLTGRSGKFAIGLFDDEDRNLYASVKFYSSEAQDASKRPELLLNYTAPAAEGIEVSSRSVVLAVGGQKELAAALVPWYAAGELSYRSEDESVVTVTQNGVLQGVKEGSCAVIVSCGEKSETVQVEVVPAPEGVQTYHASYTASSYAYTAFAGAAADDAVVYFNSHNAGWDAAAESRGYIWFDFAAYGSGTVGQATAMMFLSGSLPEAAGTMQVEIYAAPGSKTDLFAADAPAGTAVDPNAVDLVMTYIATRSFTWGQIALGQAVEVDLTDYINANAPYLEDGMVLILVTREVSAGNGLYFGGYTRTDGSTDWRPRLAVGSQAA